MRSGPVLLDGYVPDEDARAVERVLDAGAIILGEAVCESLCFSGAARATPRLVDGRTAAAGEARDEVHDAAQDRPDSVWLGHHRRQGLRARRPHPARRQVEKRKKKLSKAVYGTSHTISLAEAKHLYQKGLYQKGAAQLLIGAGQNGTVGLSEEAANYFQRLRCQVQLLPTPAAIPVWNQAEGAVIAMLHVTC